MDMDVHIHCNLRDLEKTLNIRRLTISQSGANGVCTFVSCCPVGWGGWSEITDYMLAHPKSSPGHYCTVAMGELLRKKPICDYFPNNFTHSGMWLSHKGIKHEGIRTSLA